MPHNGCHLVGMDPQLPTEPVMGASSTLVQQGWKFWGVNSPQPLRAIFKLTGGSWWVTHCGSMIPLRPLPEPGGEDTPPPGSLPESSSGMEPQGPWCKLLSFPLFGGGPKKQRDIYYYLIFIIYYYYYFHISFQEDDVGPVLASGLAFGGNQL